MKLEWMGPYRPLVEECIKAMNRYARSYRDITMEIEGVPLSAATVQVLEYILENEEEQLPMARLAERLGVTRGAFSKTTAQLCAQELVEKRHPEESGREYILTLTDKGRRVYGAYSETIYQKLFQPIFQELGQMDPAQLESNLRIYRLINRQPLQSLREEQP